MLIAGLVWGLGALVASRLVAADQPIYPRANDTTSSVSAEVASPQVVQGGNNKCWPQTVTEYCTITKTETLTRCGQYVPCSRPFQESVALLVTDLPGAIVHQRTLFF